ncbi:MAG: glycosyltransferase family 2 protein [Patescibacteria group bacterium]
MFFAIIPAYNEEKNIGSVIRSLFAHVDRIVVVDDGSTDGTADAARSAGAVVLRHAINRGQGAALETGHAYARAHEAQYVLHFDADGQFDPVDIRPALAALQESGADILFGSRFLGKHSNIPWMKRHLLFPLARLVNRMSGGVALTDGHNGFRILNRHALETIHITQDKMAHATEIAVAAKRAGLRAMEFPVSVVYREYGQGVRGGITIVKDLFFGKWIHSQKS